MRDYFLAVFRFLGRSSAARTAPESATRHSTRIAETHHQFIEDLDVTADDKLVCRRMGKLLLVACSRTMYIGMHFALFVSSKLYAFCIRNTIED